MKANESNLLRFLDSTKQFILPIFQRRYSWEKRPSNYGRTCCSGKMKIFLLISSVDVSIGDGSPTVPKFLVIDGQQRLTTISLLLLHLLK